MKLINDNRNNLTRGQSSRRISFLEHTAWFWLILAIFVFALAGPTVGTVYSILLVVAVAGIVITDVIGERRWQAKTFEQYYEKRSNSLT